MDLDHDAMRLPTTRGMLKPLNGSHEPRVAILLSIFNGERYLGEQLRSYTAQTHTNWQLYWRDDGSPDGSPALMAAFAKGRDSGQCIQLAEDGQLKRPAWSRSIKRSRG